MPCRRLAVRDAEGAAQRSKILDGEGHGHTLSRAARPPAPAIVANASRRHQAVSFPLHSFQPATADKSRRFALPVAIPAYEQARPADRAGLGVQLASEVDA
jgi:hypothetical protein